MNIAENILSELSDEQRAVLTLHGIDFEHYLEVAYDEGVSDGYSEGYREGKDDGYDTGYDEGYQDAEQDYFDKNN